MAEQKTNAMRILEREGVAYTAHPYETDGFLDGVTVAQILNRPCEMVFKTLVTRGGKEILVFVVPVAEELDLKKAARAAGVKNVEMIHVKEITPLTGYIKGGCSPVGMKKRYRTFFHQTAQELEHIIVSGGRLGLQMELSPVDLIRVTSGECCDLIKDHLQ